MFAELPAPEEEITLIRIAHFLGIAAAIVATFAPCLTQAQGQTTPLHYGAWGLDLDAVEPAISPGDDFFGYANGKWIARTPIPKDRDRATLRQLMDDRTDLQLRTLLEDEARGAERGAATLGAKVGNYFRSFMDESRVEALGMRPLQSVLADIRKARTRAQISALMGRAPYDFQSSVFGIRISVDPKNPGRYAVLLGQSGLGLPDRDYYLDARFAAKKSAYRDYTERLLGLIGWPNPGAAADEILELESQIAQASWTRAQRRDIESSYSPMTVAELEALAPRFPWRSFLAAAKLGQVDRVVIRQKSAFPRIATIFSETPVDTLRAWLAFTAADGASPYLSAAFDRAAFDFHSKTLSGLQEEEPRVKRAIRAVGGDFHASTGNFGNMGWLVGQIYVQRYFSADQKVQVEALVRNLLAAFRKRLDQVDWMSAPTKQEALHKLDAYVIKVGYPTKPRDYSQVAIRTDDLVGNVLRTARADWDFYVRRLTRPVDREEWLLTPQTDDAFNTGSILAIEFPAALLQAPMFDPHADAAVNYGAIGAFIGHEITHGFDDQGRKIDGEGRLRDWWTAADAKEFERRAATLGAQYATYEPFPGVFVDAAATMGENIADLGGVNVALDAYRESLHGQTAPVIDGLTAEQRFFFGWAQAWRGMLTDDATRMLLKSDAHAPRNLRVNGVVRNIDAWYDAFKVSEGTKLYLPPASRVKIW